MQTVKYTYAVALISTSFLLSACSEMAAEAPAAEAAMPEAPAPVVISAEASPPIKAAAKPNVPETQSQPLRYSWKAGSSTAPHAPVAVLTPALAGSEPSPVRTANEFSSYLVKVEAKDMKMSIDADKPVSGQLKVWIGQPQYEPTTQPGTKSASSVLQTSAPAASAKITPDFPDDPTAFKVKPETSTCQGVDPTGTEVPFTITPTRTGEFRVGASVELYKNQGCEGDALTRTADPITVKVTIQKPDPVTFLEIAWAAFKDFFKEILAALFAVLALIFRKRLAKLFGHKEES